MSYIVLFIVLLLCITELVCSHDNGYTLGIRDSIMIAHSFKGGN